MAINPTWLVCVAFGLGVLPILAGLVTSYVKVSIVFGLLRSALGTQQAPGALVVAAISIATSALIMGPVIEESATKVTAQQLESLIQKPSLAGFKEVSVALEPWRAFLKKHSGKREHESFMRLSRQRDPGREDSFSVLIPAFILSEVKEAFVMGFVLLLPFLAVDLIVANLLVGLGMSMVTPALISLPLKLILFVSADGWLMLVEGLVHSYGGTGGV